jgi:hypothetical protein
MTIHRPITFWLTDRTHYEMGTGNCPRARYYSKHFGPSGYGIVAKSESLPLVTGTYAHEAAARLFDHLQRKGELPDPPVIRRALAEVSHLYEQEIIAKGFRGLLQSEKSDEIVKEQLCLLTGLTWALALKFLPWFHQNYTVIAVEQEALSVLSCDCGLTPQDHADQHLERGCTGITLQQRQDLIAQNRVSGALAYFEFKTTSDDAARFMEKWETTPQLALGTINAQERWGRPIEELYVVGLYKGYREKVYDDQDRIVGFRQMSPFCTAYMRPGNPPLAPDDWKASYRYFDDSTGKWKQVTKDYQKTPVWKLDTSDWPTRLQHMDIGSAECWVRTLPDKTLENQLYLLGPMKVQTEQLASLRRQISGEEARWQAIAWELYQIQAGGTPWHEEAVQSLLDRLVPASWACRRYGKAYSCQFMRICFKDLGWEDPIGSGAFVPRLPHHVPELEQAISRGLIPEQAAAETEEE